MGIGPTRPPTTVGTRLLRTPDKGIPVPGLLGVRGVDSDMGGSPSPVLSLLSLLCGGVVVILTPLLTSLLTVPLALPVLSVLLPLLSLLLCSLLFVPPSIVITTPGPIDDRLVG